MEKIRFQRRHLRANQEPNRISGGVSIVLRIPRLASKPRENGDIGGIDDQSTTETKSSLVFKEECAYYISDLDTSDLTIFSAFILSSSSTLERLFEIVYIIFLNYIFF